LVPRNVDWLFGVATDGVAVVVEEDCLDTAKNIYIYEACFGGRRAAHLFN